MLICFNCARGQRILQNKIHIIFDMMLRNSVGCWSAFGARSLKRFIWKRDKASAIELTEPSICIVLKLILLLNVHNTNDLINFITDFDFEVLVFIIVTRALLSILKIIVKLRVPRQQCQNNRYQLEKCNISHYFRSHPGLLPPEL